MCACWRVVWLTWLQGQDWDFIAHTFWLKHGVAMLFDSLYLAEGITLAYNSGTFY